MKIIYKDKHPTIDKSMSDSNIGAGKQKKHKKSYFHCKLNYLWCYEYQLKVTYWCDDLGLQVDVKQTLKIW